MCYGRRQPATFWSLVALTTKQIDAYTYPVTTRVSVLLLLGVYLCLEWIRNYRSLPNPITRRFLLFDLLHLLAVALTAIATFDDSTLLIDALVLYFAVTGTGHLDTVMFAVINYLGILIIFSGFFTNSGYIARTAWALPLSMAVVIALWVARRWRRLRELFGYTT